MLAPRKKLHSTPAHVVDAALALAEVGAGDLVLDIGCGDGQPLIRVAQQTEARGLGIEIEEARAAEAREAVSAAGVADRVEVRSGNALDLDLAAEGASVVFMFLTRRGMRLLLPMARAVTQRTRFVSYLYPFEGVRPLRREWVQHATDGDEAARFPLFLYEFGGEGGAGEAVAEAGEAVGAGGEAAGAGAED